MGSRMDRYRDDNQTITPRTKRNEERYENLYREKNYDAYDNIVDIYNTNEIDITKVKKILQSRDDYRRTKDFKKVIQAQPKSRDFYPIKEEPLEEREYDINSILSKAKQGRTHEEMDNKYRRLRNTQYDILSNLDVGRRKEPIREPIMDEKEINEMTHEARELKSLLDTITNVNITKTKPLEDPSDLFADLKSSGNTVADLKVEQVEPKRSGPQIDKSFYTSSFTFDDADFEDFEKPHKRLKDRGVGVKILIGTLIVSLLVIIFLVVKIFFLK